MSQPSLSVIIPALPPAAGLAATLRALAEAKRAGLIREVLVVSETPLESLPTTTLPLRLIPADSRGRGRQLAVGGAAAESDWLLFLHADTCLAPGWSRIAIRFMLRPEAAQQAGYFALALDDPAPQARRVEQLANWRARRLKLPYGDQGLLIHRHLYQRLGGFRPLPLMEDVEFVRRLGGQRLVPLEAQAVTSAARYRKDGWWARPARNLCLLSLYFLGCPPNWLRRLYG